MRIRNYDHSDYDEIKQWWSDRNQIPVAPEALSTTGAVCVRADEIRLAAAWLYLSNSKLAYLGWVIGRPNTAYYEVHEAITLVTSHLVNLADVLGFPSIISTSGNRGLTRILKRNGLISFGPHELLYGGF